MVLQGAAVGRELAVEDDCHPLAIADVNNGVAKQRVDQVLTQPNVDGTCGGREIEGRAQGQNCHCEDGRAMRARTGDGATAVLEGKAAVQDDVLVKVAVVFAVNQVGKRLPRDVAIPDVLVSARARGEQ